MSKECECSSVKLYDDKWQCMMCARPFVPLISQPEKPEHVIKLIDDENVYHYTIGVIPNPSRTCWRFEVKHNDVLVGSGDDYVTGIMARRAADAFISHYVVRENSSEI